MTSEFQYVYGSSNAAYTEGIVPNPNRRMTISSNVKLRDNIWDSRSGRIIPEEDEQPRRQRVQGMTIELKHLNEYEARAQKWAEKGWLGKRLNLSTAMVIAMALFVLLGMFTLSHRSSLEDWNDKYEITMRGVSQVREENEEIQARIDDAKREEDITYRAANELGMIRAGDAHTIPLNAVDAYPQEVVQAGYTAEVVVDGWGEEQVSHVSVAASAE
ncbi:MAG: hypothetical protein J6K73_01755 [Clostridia bacterium]|nr:hypothetical protein [Clostridia bacterium]MBP3648488.1 hypothetical protein [Clostridia bacterium]